MTQSGDEALVRSDIRKQTLAPGTLLLVSFASNTGWQDGACDVDYETVCLTSFSTDMQGTVPGRA